jgi:type II secretory pathway pseudopilin PulG
VFKRFSAQMHGYGFTVLELVLVVAVIMVLMASLAPSLMDKKSSAYKAVCTYNLHSVGLAMQSYAYDNGMYPIADPIVPTLTADGYLSEGQDLQCPLDISTNGDTYSFGYVGAHPNSVYNNDPLVVCGWHQNSSALTVFADTSVDELGARTGNSTLPVTAVYNGNIVNPGFALQASGPLQLISAAGQQALMFGENGTSYVAATYDSSADTFKIVTSFEATSTSPQVVRGISTNPLDIYTRFEYCAMRYSSVPLSTSLQWHPGSPANELTMSLYQDYDVTHRVTGKRDASSTPQIQSRYAVSVDTMEKQ